MLEHTLTALALVSPLYPHVRSYLRRSCRRSAHVRSCLRRVR